MRPFLISIMLLCLSFPVFAQESTSTQPYTPWMDKAQTATTNNSVTKKTKKAESEKQQSALEKLYAERIIDAPEQFGYDLFHDAAQNTPQSTAPMGAVQDDYILGAGDELTISFSGQRTDRNTYTIDARGLIFIEDLPPISASGQSIGNFSHLLNAQLQNMHNTKAYISLSATKQISVLVVGNVKSPGRKTINMFNTTLDALNLSGGIKKDGSLRRIKLVRNGHSTHIDLYALLMHGAPHIDMQLKDGDRLIIPPIGPTVAISGAVKRPGIYEIKQTRYGINAHNKNNSEMLTLNEMLDLAGGTLSATQNRFIKLEEQNNGNESVRNITDMMTPSFSNGTILSVTHGDTKKAGQIELIGQTTRPGLYDLDNNKTLASLLTDETILGHDIYPLMGVIERWDKKQLGTRYISFPLRLVLNNNFDISLKDDDTIYLLSNNDISISYNEKNFDTYTIENIEQGSGNSDSILQINGTLKNYIKEHSVFVRGAVRKPGQYPVAEGTTLENILAIAGGITLEANRESIEVTTKNLGEDHQSSGRSGTQRSTIDLNTTSPATILISAGDAVRVNQKFRKMDEKTVMIIGEVLHPGEYDILAGDKVSDLIERAGGLSEQAYPKGSIFSRESERKTEEIRFRSAAHQMEQRLAAAIERDKNPPDSTQIQMVRDLAKELSEIEAVGRITVETDPSILSTTPELDMYLEKGDRVYIPKRPLTVRVHGEILSPASLQFRKNKDPLDYIHEAGGFTYHADKDRTFVLYPDGSAQPLRVNTWNHTPIFIPPGSTIVVPRDPKPFDFMESAKDVGQILSNLAITSVFIDDIRD
ncbi:MAG: SLBB domain-containing protein [Alphaproteobacteria bacterium]